MTTKTFTSADKTMKMAVEYDANVDFTTITIAEKHGDDRRYKVTESIAIVNDLVPMLIRALGG